mmetsp:Transcript_20688/g.40632  ORF Transcript_20688/g.40632 Transcript_20688/m.40632 type:complete len:203 (-) Transcript_20688:39-647(-)
MLTKTVSEPVAAETALLTNKVKAASCETWHIANLNLKNRQLADNLKVVRVEPDGHLETLDGFLVVFVATVDHSVDVPADGAFDVVAHAELGKLIGLVLLAHAVVHEALHGIGLAMFGKLLQDCVCSLDGLLVLLALLKSDELFEEPILLLGQDLRVRASGCWRRRCGGRGLFGHRFLLAHYGTAAAPPLANAASSQQRLVVA